MSSLTYHNVMTTIVATSVVTPTSILCAVEKSSQPVRYPCPQSSNVLILSSDGENSVVVTLTDRCVACGMTDLDFSPAAFKQLADPNIGRMDITWEWA